MHLALKNGLGVVKTGGQRGDSVEMTPKAQGRAGAECRATLGDPCEDSRRLDLRAPPGQAGVSDSSSSAFTRGGSLCNGI